VEQRDKCDESAADEKDDVLQHMHTAQSSLHHATAGASGGIRDADTPQMHLTATRCSFEMHFSKEQGHEVAS
jgi:hypothetical protein